jgi:integrase
MAGKLITDTSIRKDAALAASSGRRVDIYDKGIRGLVLRLTPAGHISFAFAFRPKGEKSTSRITIGPYPTISLATARKVAKEHSEAVTLGRDIPAERRAEKEQRRKAEAELADRITVAEGFERYLRLQVKKQRTKRNFQASFDKDVMPAIGNKALADITKLDFQKIIDGVEDRGAMAQAENVLQITRAMFNWCIGRGYIEVNPVATFKVTHRKQPRERFLTVGEIRAFWRQLPGLAMYEEERSIFRLQTLLGQRIGEVASMMRHEIDVERKVWTIPGERSKNGRPHEVPLPPMAREIIEAAMRSRAKGLLFPRPHDGKPLTPNALATSLLRSQNTLGFKDAKGDPHPFTSHDLRRTMATWLEQSGTPSSVIALALNHTDTKGRGVTRTHYLHGDTLKAKRLAFTTWEKHIRSILIGHDPFAQTFDDVDAIEADLLSDAPAINENDINI